MKRSLILITLVTALCFPAWANNIASEWVKIAEVRSITNGNVYFVLNTIAMCNTDTLLLKVIDDNSKVTYSTLLAAASAGKEVKLETWGDCAPNGGWGTEIQAVNVKFP